MWFAQSRYGLLKMVSLATSVLLLGCAALPAPVAAQQIGFFIVQGPPDPGKSNLSVWSANCPKLDARSSKAQTLQCTLERDECKPGSCKFTVNSTDEPPTALVFGRSSHNPTCAWVFDWASYRYIYRCW